MIIVGCGPAGLAASLNCLHHGLRFRTFEKEDIGGTVRHYQRKKIVMTAPATLPGYGKLKFREVLKEELISLWGDIVSQTGLEVDTGETLHRIERNDGRFTVTTASGAHQAKRVVLAIGRRGVPRKLSIPGEELAHVIYSLPEPEAYQQDRVVVVGGGDTAVEAALALADQPGNHVKISYRRAAFSRIKPNNMHRVEDALERQRIEVLWSSTILEIKSDGVVLKDHTDTVRSIPSDLVAIFAGGELPTKFLTDCGVAIDTKFGAP